MKYIIELKRYRKFTETPVVFYATDDSTKVIGVSELKEQAHQFDLEEAQQYIEKSKLRGEVNIVPYTQKKEYKCIKEWTLTTRHIPEGAIVHVTSNDNSFMINVEYQGHTRQMNWATFRTHFEEVKK